MEKPPEPIYNNQPAIPPELRIQFALDPNEWNKLRAWLDNENQVEIATATNGQVFLFNTTELTRLRIALFNTTKVT